MIDLVGEDEKKFGELRYEFFIIHQAVFDISY